MKKNNKNNIELSGLAQLRYLPCWIVFVIDLAILILSFIISFNILRILGVDFYDNISFMQKMGLVVGINVIFMVLFRTFSGIIRHSSFNDIFKLFLACVGTGVTVFFINILSTIFLGRQLMRVPILIFYFTLSFSCLFLLRIAVKEFFHRLKEFKNIGSKEKILIFGIGDDSVGIAHAIIENPAIPYVVEGFFTERNDSTFAKLLGRKIITKSKFLASTNEELGITGVILIKEHFDEEAFQKWVNILVDRDLKVLKAPSIAKLGKQDLKSSIKKIQIEDLLSRKVIKLEDENIKKRHYGKTVLITGGAGSIGSELVRQVAQFNPGLILVLDQAETPLYDIELEVTKSFPHIRFHFILADVSNQRRIEAIFSAYDISMVYHAAAYKHVPMIESNPREAVLVNVMGTRILAKLASQHKVNRFVMVSTDKAVNPTNVMGASKRTAELFVQALQNVEGNTTKFITTRFGNVLGSNGSVIPHFQKQIEAGGPVTVTHPDIVRYFMTIPEACQLVLEAGTMGQGGEIFVFDMGNPVKIVDLAHRMIKLSGLEPIIDIPIEFTGLRPGEKLYEELLSDGTKNMPTHHDKIMISKDDSVPYSVIDHKTYRLTRLALSGNKLEVVQMLKEIVPEFKSKNSVFEMLDRKVVEK